MQRLKKLKTGGLLAGVAVLAAGAFLFINHPSKSAEETDVPAPKTVAVVKAGHSNLARVISLTAELHPWQEIDIHPKVAGYLKDINVDIGDHVKQDEVIATLELPEQQQDELKAEADYNVAKLDYDRLEAVMKKQPGLLAEDVVDNAQGAYEEAKAAYDRTRILADYATITAPFDGIITKRFADPGALVQAGTSSNTQSMPLVHLAEMDKLRLNFPVPESVVPDIKDGMPVDVLIEATGEKIHSKIARIADRVDPSTRTMTVEVDLDNPDMKLKPGMYATANVVLASKPDALAVPVQAIAFGDKPNVWVVNKNGIVEEHPVRLGIQNPDAVEVLSGVSAGDALVYGNRGDIAVGMKVAPKVIDDVKG